MIHGLSMLALTALAAKRRPWCQDKEIDSLIRLDLVLTALFVLLLWVK